MLHVHSPATVPAFSDHEPHATLEWEREFLARHISTPHDRITLLRRLGVPADDVVAVARETGPDLIVLAWGQDLAPGHARVVSETLAHSDDPRAAAARPGHRLLTADLRQSPFNCADSGLSQ